MIWKAQGFFSAAISKLQLFKFQIENRSDKLASSPIFVSGSSEVTNISALLFSS